MITAAIAFTTLTLMALLGTYRGQRSARARGNPDE